MAKKKGTCETCYWKSRMDNLHTCLTCDDWKKYKPKGGKDDRSTKG